MRSNLPVFHHNTVRILILSNSPTCKHETSGYVLSWVGGAEFISHINSESFSLVFLSDILKRQTRWCTNARVVRKWRPARERWLWCAVMEPPLSTPTPTWRNAAVWMLSALPKATPNRRHSRQRPLRSKEMSKIRTREKSSNKGWA